MASKSHSDKLRLIINMRYVNAHLAKRVFKFIEVILSDITEMAEKETIISLITSHQVNTMWASNGWADIINTVAFPSGYRPPLGYSQKSFVT